MELQGKKMVFLGDSITEGAGVSDPANRYWERLARRTSAVCVGYGIGGTRIARQQHPVPDQYHDFHHFSTRLAEMDKDADIVVIFGGVNDFGHGDAPFGTFTDRTEDTFYGALHVLYTAVLEQYPEAQIVVMTPTHFSAEWDHAGETGPGRKRSLREYVEAIREVAEYYALPVLDLYRVSGIQPLVPAMRDRYMPDGLHPNDAGHARIEEKLFAFLHTLA